MTKFDIKNRKIIKKMLWYIYDGGFKMENNLRLIVLDNCKEAGKRINDHLKSMFGVSEDFVISHQEVRFKNGEAKVKINESIREKDVYILCDVGNYSETYEMYGFVNHKSPDDHFQDLKRVI